MASPRLRGGTNKVAELAKAYFTEMNNLWEFSNRWPSIIRNGNATNPDGLQFVRAAAFMDYIEDELAKLNTIVTDPAAGASAIDLRNYIRSLPSESVTRDLVTDYQATVAAAVACGDWLIANLPIDTSYVESVANRRPVYARATPAQAEPLAVLLETLNATIEA